MGLDPSIAAAVIGVVGGPLVLGTFVSWVRAARKGKLSRETAATAAVKARDEIIAYLYECREMIIKLGGTPPRLPRGIRPKRED